MLLFKAYLYVWPPRQTLLDKHILLVNISETFQKHFLLVCQARVCVVAKQTNIVLDKQNFKCLPSNVCPLGQGLMISCLRMPKKLHIFLKNSETRAYRYWILLRFSGQFAVSSSIKKNTHMNLHNKQRESPRVSE